RRAQARPQVERAQELAAVRGLAGEGRPFFRTDRKGGSLGQAAVRSLVVGFAVWVALPASAGTGRATIQITDVQTHYTFVDQGPRGRGAGDVEVIRQSLFNRRISPRSIGHADLMCTLLSTVTRTCSATYVLPRGTLMT